MNTQADASAQDGHDACEDACLGRSQRYKHAERQGGSDFDDAFARVKRLFASPRIQEDVFGPLRKVFEGRSDSTDDSVRSVITKVAVTNAVLAGLPGKLGVGVVVSMAIEAWMAFSIARHVGVRIKEPGDVLKYFGILAGVMVSILWMFRQLLGLAFSLLSVIPGNPMILAELIVTDLVGVLFWVGFQEAARTGSFTVPKRALAGCIKETGNLFRYQGSRIRDLLTMDNIRKIAGRLAAYFKGDHVVPPPRIQDDLFAGVAMATLMHGDYDSLDGPMGREFLQSIRDIYPDLQDAGEAEIAEVMGRYSDEQLTGVLANIKGRMFERMVEAAENADGDAWIARLHEDRTHPSTDIVFENTETGELWEVSLKATDNPSYIEEALARYPDDDIMTTTEVHAHYEDSDRVYSSGIRNEYVSDVTEENFDGLLDRMEPDRFEAGKAMGIGAGVGAALALWPFVAAYCRKKISMEQLERACVHVLGASGKRLAVKIVALAVFGPIVLWALLAKTVMQIVGTSNPER